MLFTKTQTMIIKRVEFAFLHIVTWFRISIKANLSITIFQTIKDKITSSYTLMSIDNYFL